MDNRSYSIRALEMTADLDRVVKFYTDAPDYWEMAEGKPPGLKKAREFFEDVPPNSDPETAHRQGFFIGDRLSGIADLFFDYPDGGDAYIGLMIFSPQARSRGFGKTLLNHLEELACVGEATTIYTAVMTINPRGRAFWEREGFIATGLSGMSVVGDHQQELHRLAKSL